MELAVNENVLSYREVSLLGRFSADEQKCYVYWRTRKAVCVHDSHSSCREYENPGLYILVECTPSKAVSIWKCHRLESTSDGSILGFTGSGENKWKVKWANVNFAEATRFEKILEDPNGMVPIMSHEDLIKAIHEHR